MNRNIEYIEPSRLSNYEKNSRTHSADQITQIAKSIKEFGFTNPVLIDADNGIIAGHGRVAAAKQMGMAMVPCLRLTNLTDEQKRAYIIADNKLALNAGWDLDVLKMELQSLADLGFDLPLIGFSEDELKDLLPVDDYGKGKDSDSENGFVYSEKFSIVVECDNEQHQQEVFDKFQKDGYVCRVLVN